MARNAIITCQSQPLQLIADCPRPRGGPSAVQNFNHSERLLFLENWKKEGRTVRPLLREGHQKLEFLSRNHMLGGGPSALYFGAQHKNLEFLSRKKMVVGGPSAPEGRTVRPYTFQRNKETPISVQVQIRRGGPSAPQKRTVRPWHLAHKNKPSYHFLKDVVSPHACN